MSIQELNRELGNIDLFLLDQILKGRFENANRILDAGCGEGRNLFYFIKNAYDVWGIDNNPSALQMLRMIARSLHKNFDPEKFIASEITEIPFPPASFDAVICLAVLHFSPSEEAFFIALDEMIKVLRKDGFIFISMRSSIGIENKVANSGQNMFLLTAVLYRKILDRYKLKEIEPFKTLLVGDAQATSYLILKKEG